MLLSVSQAATANWPLPTFVVGQSRGIIGVKTEQKQCPNTALRAAEDKCSLHDVKFYTLNRSSLRSYHYDLYQSVLTNHNMQLFVSID